MASPKSKTPRAIAAHVLDNFKSTGVYAASLLHEQLGVLAQARQRQQATDLVLGTLRNRTAIDHVIGQLAHCTTERIPPRLLNIIRIGAYELLYCPETDDYAAVNEAVSNAKTVAGKKQTGFVNAVLRQISRHITNRRAPITDTPARSSLVQNPSFGCYLDTSVLPSPQDEPAAYYSTAFSLPEWLVSQWLDHFGAEKTRQICLASNRNPGIYLRPNPLKTGTEQLARMLAAANVNATICPEHAMIRIKSARPIGQLPGFARGLFSVQDITASLPVRHLKPLPGSTILDLCAAPGSKTTQLAELTADKAHIIATDIHPDRLEMVRENLIRLGLRSIRLVDYHKLQKQPCRFGPFDAILLDVPCSNTSVVARRPEVRFRIKPHTIAKLTAIQAGLLRSAAKMLKNRGKICYSTCSIHPAENRSIIEKFLKDQPGFELAFDRLTLPCAEQFDCDGGYFAILRAL